MELTIKQPSGQPVFIGDNGKIIGCDQAVKAIRKQNNLSVRELADHCGVSPRTVENWEQGHRPPSLPALKLLAQLIQKEDL